MLVIKHKHHLDFPHMTFNLPHAMEFEAIPVDEELSQAGQDEVAQHENNWQLAERPDTSELEQFWSQVTDDVRSDPDWANFSAD